MYTIGFDDNLGLPQDFTQALDCCVVSYHDVEALIRAYATGELNAIFTPAGTLPYISAPYQILAQATMGSLRKVSMISYLCGLKETSLSHIAQKKLGRVNRFCTTSYWAVKMYMMKMLPQPAKLIFEDTDGFEDMLTKTVSGEIAYSMIWERVLDKYPDLAQKLRIMCSSDELPTPLMIGQKSISPSWIALLQNFHTHDPNGYFNGFTHPDEAHIKKFKQDLLEINE